MDVLSAEIQRKLRLVWISVGILEEFSASNAIARPLILQLLSL
jgi:hypothetical protein